MSGFNIVDGGEVTVKGLFIVVYGDINVGKTTTALTADKPILFDFDSGIQRCDIRSGKKVIRINDWKTDIEPKLSNMAEYLKDYNTLIIDTADACLRKLKSYVIDIDPKGTRDKRNMYGMMKDRFDDFSNRVNALGKHVIVAGHKDTEEENGVTRTVMQVTGGSKNIIYQRADFMGYIRMVNNKRVISFKPNDYWDGKTVSNYVSEYELPDCFTNPDFFAQEIEKMVNAINSRATTQMEKAKVITDFSVKIAAAANAYDMNKLIYELQQLQDTNLIKNQIWKLMQNRAAKLPDVQYDKEKKTYIDLTPPAPEPKKNGTPTPPAPEPQPEPEPQGIAADEELDMGWPE